MAETASPFGIRPSGSLSTSGSYTGKRRAYKIASGYAQDIVLGDPVELVAGGVVELCAGFETPGAIVAVAMIGIFVGVQYTDPISGTLVQDQRWPSGTVAADAVAFVVDDPHVQLIIQADGALVQTAIGANFALIAATPSLNQKISRISLDASSVATTNTFPIRVLGFVDGPTAGLGQAFPEVVCAWNAGHQILTALGVV